MASETSPTDEALAPLTPYVGGRIQKASLTHDGRVVLEVFGQGKAWVVLAPTHPEHPLVVTLEKPPRDEKPPGAQRVVRDALSGEKLVDIERPRPDVVAFTVVTRDERPRTIWLEIGNDPRLVLTAAKSKDAQEKVLVVVGGDVKTKDGRDLRRGRLYVPPKGDPPNVDPLLVGQQATAPKEVQKRDHALSALRVQLKARQRRYSRLVKALEGDLRRHGDPQALRRNGDALKHLLASGQPPPTKGSERVVIDLADGASLPVVLDVTRDLVGNMEAYYRRARRAEQAQEKVRPRLSEAQATLQEIEDARAAVLENPPSDEARAEAERLVGETSAKGVRRKAASATAARRPYRAFLAHGDVVVRVGRSAKDNDELTFHLAAGNDVWMHAREVAGSHVLFPAPADVPQELLLDAAHLAAWFSPLQKADRIDLQWTRRKFIRKPGKGAPAGFVHVTKEKVLHLVVDEKRTQALLAREVDGTTRPNKRDKRAAKTARNR